MNTNAVKVLYHRNAEELYKSDDAIGIDYATSGSAGLDLRAIIDEEQVCVKAGERFAVPTGISIEILAENLAGFVYSRSGLGAKKGLTVAQGVGVIDYDYRGEIIVFLLNTSMEDYSIQKGERIAQLVFQPAYRLEVIKADSLGQTQRGQGGFGHTGK